MRRIRNNYRFVIGFNGALIGLGVTGILPPTTSAMLHNLSTLGVSLHSMTALPRKSKIKFPDRVRRVCTGLFFVFHLTNCRFRRIITVLYNTVIRRAPMEEKSNVTLKKSKRQPWPNFWTRAFKGLLCGRS